MKEAEYKTINVVLSTRELDIINSYVRAAGLGGKGFSAALRIIVREWAASKDLPLATGSDREDGRR